MIEDLIYYNYLIFSYFLILLFVYSIYYQIKLYVEEFGERVSLQDLKKEEMTYNIDNPEIKEKQQKLLNNKENRLDKILQVKKED